MPKNVIETQPKEIKKIGGKELKIVWSDGHTSTYSFQWLRQNCQCAVCVEEWRGEQLLPKETISKEIEGLKVNLVGQYALTISFSDGHNTGIFAFQFLRKICPCETCKKLESYRVAELKNSEGNSQTL